MSSLRTRGKEAEPKAAKKLGSSEAIEARVVEEAYVVEFSPQLQGFLCGLTGRARDEAKDVIVDQLFETLYAIKERREHLRPLGKPLGRGLFELKGHQVRIFFMNRPGRRILLLDGEVKKAQRYRPDVIERVRRLQRAVEKLDRA